MAGFVVKGRLLAQAILFLVSVLLADTAVADQLPDSTVFTRDGLVTLPFYIDFFCNSMAVIFACWAAYRWRHNTRKKIPLKPVRFGLVVFAAVLFASLPFILDALRDYYGPHLSSP
jgi:hypothetical protein